MCIQHPTLGFCENHCWFLPCGFSATLPVYPNSGSSVVLNGIVGSFDFVDLGQRFLQFLTVFFDVMRADPPTCLWRGSSCEVCLQSFLWSCLGFHVLKLHSIQLSKHGQACYCDAAGFSCSIPSPGYALLCY